MRAKTWKSAPFVDFMLKAGSALIFIGLFVGGRIFLSMRLIENSVTLQALAAETLLALAIIGATALICRLHALLGAGFILLASVLHITNIEMISSLQTVFYVQDVLHGVGRAFVQGSFFSPSFVSYALPLVTAALFFIWAWSRRGTFQPRTLLLLSLISVISVVLLFTATSTFSRNHPGEEWEVSSLVWTMAKVSLTAETIDRIGEAQSFEEPTETEEVQETSPAFSETNGEARFNEESRPGGAENKPNVLLVVLEGMAGPYLRQVQETIGIEYPVLMDGLSEIAEEAVVVPNVVAHNRQTIRGLYSIMTGDYPELGLVTPRLYTYMSLPQKRRPAALPRVLASAGYETVFLQGADLSYMSKDQFMKAVGFDRIHGREYFDKQYIPFGWGPDDKAFFEGAFELLEELQNEEKPWFLTLLNVGTHHPYAVTEEMAEEHMNKKVAAVHHLDTVMSEFYKRMKERGYLEDTLVFFVSDESHGVGGQPYGRFWPLAMIRTPEGEPSIQEGRYGLVDVSWTILEYLELEEAPRLIPRRSMLVSDSDTRRPLLFERFTSPEPGVIYELFGEEEIKAYHPEGGVLYADSYATEIVSGDERREILSKIETLRRQEKQRLEIYAGERQRYQLIHDGDYVLSADDPRMISTGQYLDIPAESIATIDLVAEVKAAEGADTSVSGPVILDLELRHEGKEVELEELSIPVIRKGERLELSFSFDTSEAMLQMWTVLSAENLGKEGSTSLRVKDFSLGFRSGSLPEGFREEKKTVETIGQ